MTTYPVTPVRKPQMIQNMKNMHGLLLVLLQKEHIRKNTRGDGGPQQVQIFQCLCSILKIEQITIKLHRFHQQRKKIPR